MKKQSSDYFYLFFLLVNVIFLFLRFFYNYNHIVLFGKVFAYGSFYILLIFYLCWTILPIYVFLKGKKRESYIILILFYFFNLLNSLVNYHLFTKYFLNDLILRAAKNYIYFNFKLIGFMVLLHIILFISLFTNYEKIKIYFLSILIIIYVIAGCFSIYNISKTYDSLDNIAAVVAENDFIKNNYVCKDVENDYEYKCFQILGEITSLEQPIHYRFVLGNSSIKSGLFFRGFAYKNNVEYCNNIKNDDFKNICLAVNYKKKEYCKLIINPFMKQICLERYYWRS